MKEHEGDKQSFSSKILFKRFFLNYFLLGIVIVLIAISLEQLVIQKSYVIWVGIRMLETIGIAVVIASIFEYSIGTNEFILKIQSFLQGIIVNRNFLSDIDVEGKRRALAALIKPSASERRICANLDNYYDMCINQILDVTKKCVRSDYVVFTRIYFDSTKNKIAAQEDMSYRVYPTVVGYDPIRVGIIEADVDTHLDLIAINTPDGESKSFTEFEWTRNPTNLHPGQSTEVNLDDIAREGHSHLDVEIKLTEFGFDHWIALGWQALQPTDGFKYHIWCDPGITIKSKQYFVHGAKMQMDVESDKEICFTCNQWFNEGTGIFVIASKNEDIASGNQ